MTKTDWEYNDLKAIYYDFLKYRSGRGLDANDITDITESDPTGENDPEFQESLK